eukprot:Hpha_TRINITY_DN15371_c1_g1::TRINITY_DN15371_c1_g1_i1::g.92288::m.92288
MRRGLVMERPPPAPPPTTAASAFDMKAPFASASVGSIVRPSTSPMVGLYGTPAATVGSRFSGRPDEADALAPDALQEQPASTLLLRRGSHGSTRSHSQRNSAPQGRPSTSGFQGIGGLDTGIGGRREPMRGPARVGRVEEARDEPGDMMVEGVQTGEGKAMEQSKDRQSGRNVSMTRSRSFEQGQRDRNAIRKLEQEVGRLRNLCDSQQKQISALREATGDGVSKEEMRELQKRAELAERQQREAEERGNWAETRSTRIQEDLEQMLRDERQRISNIRGEAEDREVEARIRCRELEDRVDSNNRERDGLRCRLEEAEAECRRIRDKALNDRLAVESKDREIGDLRGQQRSREAMICQLKAALAEDASTVERLRTEMRDMRDEHVQKEAELIERRRKADQFQEYVMKICQPHFAVVKDDSLCPVNVSGFQVTEGYVLVPLILLLEGYALLPPQLKSVIDAKSSKLARGIDYSAKAPCDIAARPPEGKQSYKDRLYSMMDDGDHPSSAAASSGPAVASRHGSGRRSLPSHGSRHGSRGSMMHSSWPHSVRGEAHNGGRDRRDD